jgi:NAD(P)-dependent dehydrogenase (short-subunit alcohol dehydrogenase family)
VTSCFLKVNYYGIIRMVQAFLPIFKNQLLEKEYYCITRIVNVVSMAGLVSGMPGISGYHASKFAAQAYTDCLRAELQPFHIAVSSINPTFHATPIVTNFDTDTGENMMKQISDDTIKSQYGKCKILSLRNSILFIMFVGFVF